MIWRLLLCALAALMFMGALALAGLAFVAVTAAWTDEPQWALASFPLLASGVIFAAMGALCIETMKDVD